MGPHAGSLVLEIFDWSPKLRKEQKNFARLRAKILLFFVEYFTLLAYVGRLKQLRQTLRLRQATELLIISQENT